MSNIWEAAVLGALQGLTEFLPVSSSGHLVLAQNLIPGFSQPGVLFDVVVHLGTVGAVVYFFRKTLINLDRKYLILLVVGTVPAGIVGVLFSSNIEGLFGNVKLVGFTLLITALLNFLTDRTNRNQTQVTLKKSFLIGMAQAMAIVPGISRSGSTIFAGTKLGIEKRKATEFSFFLSVPAILGASLVQFFKYGADGVSGLGFYAVGFLAAFFSGVLAIKLVLRFLLSKRFIVFAFYSLILGLLVIFFM